MNNDSGNKCMSLEVDMEPLPGSIMELTSLHTFLPKKIYVEGVKDEKVWVVDIPRTMKIARYLTLDEICRHYK